MKTILCIEDEREVLDNNRAALMWAGYAVLAAENLAQARKQLLHRSPDAIVLDIMLPDGNGLDFLRELRAAGNRIPVLMLTARGESASVAKGLRAGANDYLGKPFDYEVLLARVEALFRNVEQVPEALERGPLKLDIAAGRAFLNGVDMLLTQKEFSLLLLFVQDEGHVMSAEYLYKKSWGQPIGDDHRTLKKHMSNLRRKLEEGNSGYKITAARGEGYCFEKI
ncbi:MAG: response regulator transcription factor [Candidatus Accumulibacter sp.]|jgi:DNA-binding response OmpR family regulator|nr:response regulator transcription factor [Accumulibacter sp.]